MVALHPDRQYIHRCWHQSRPTIYIDTYIYMYIYLFTYLFIYMYLYAYIHKYMYTHICTYLYKWSLLILIGNIFIAVGTGLAPPPQPRHEMSMLFFCEHRTEMSVFSSCAVFFVCYPIPFSYKIMPIKMQSVVKKNSTEGSPILLSSRLNRFEGVMHRALKPNISSGWAASIPSSNASSSVPWYEWGADPGMKWGWRQFHLQNLIL